MRRRNGARGASLRLPAQPHYAAAYSAYPAYLESDAGGPDAGEPDARADGKGGDDLAQGAGGHAVDKGHMLKEEERRAREVLPRADRKAQRRVPAVQKKCARWEGCVCVCVCEGAGDG